jgi:hypothetical protein
VVGSASPAWVQGTPTPYNRLLSAPTIGQVGHASRPEASSPTSAGGRQPPAWRPQAAQARLLRAAVGSGDACWPALYMRDDVLWIRGVAVIRDRAVGCRQGWRWRWPNGAEHHPPLVCGEAQGTRRTAKSRRFGTIGLSKQPLRVRQRSSARMPDSSTARLDAMPPCRHIAAPACWPSRHPAPSTLIPLGNRLFPAPPALPVASSGPPHRRHGAAASGRRWRTAWPRSCARRSMAFAYTRKRRLLPPIRRRIRAVACPAGRPRRPAGPRCQPARPAPDPPRSEQMTAPSHPRHEAAKTGPAMAIGGR